MLFDTHAHMDDRAFDGDREKLLASLPEAGIGLLMNPGCSLASSKNAVDLANRYGYIRSEERRVGKECISRCRCRWWAVH